MTAGGMIDMIKVNQVGMEEKPDWEVYSKMP